VASAIFVGVCGGVSSGDRESCPPENHSDPTVELSCISMSLLEKISSALMSGSLPPAATLYYAEVLTGLQDMDLMLQLVSGLPKTHIHFKDRSQ